MASSPRKVVTRSLADPVSDSPVWALQLVRDFMDRTSLPRYQSLHSISLAVVVTLLVSRALLQATWLWISVAEEG